MSLQAYIHKTEKSAHCYIKVNLQLSFSLDDMALVHYTVELQDSKGEETSGSGGSTNSTAIIASALAMVVALSVLTIVIIIVAVYMKRRPSVRDGISKSLMRDTCN